MRYLHIRCLRSTQIIFHRGNTNNEHVTCLTNTVLPYVRATDHSSSIGILQLHLHSRKSNTKYSAGYMLSAEEQLEARSTERLFAYQISSSPTQQILQINPTSGRWQKEQEAPWIGDSLARSETDAEYSTLKFNYNVFLCSSCLFIKQVSSEGKQRNPLASHDKACLLLSGSSGFLYFIVWDWHRFPFFSLLYLHTTEQGTCNLSGVWI